MSSYAFDASRDREATVVTSIECSAEPTETSEALSSTTKSKKRKRVTTANTTWEHTRKPQGAEPGRVGRKHELIYYCKYCGNPPYSTTVSTTFRNHLYKQHHIQVDHESFPARDLDAQPSLVLTPDKDGQDRIVSSVTQEVDDVVKNAPWNHCRAVSETSPLRDTIVVAQPQPSSVRYSTTESVNRKEVSTLSQKNSTQKIPSRYSSPYTASGNSQHSIRISSVDVSQRTRTGDGVSLGSGTAQSVDDYHSLQHPGSQGVVHSASEKEASDPSPGPKKQPHIAQSLSNVSARAQEPGLAQRPATTTTPARGSNPNHCDDAKASAILLGGSRNRDGGFGTASPTNGDAAQENTVAGANKEDGSSTPQGPTSSSVPVQNATPSVPGPIAEHHDHLVDSTRTSRGDETSAGNQLQLGDADDEEALRVGHVFMKYKRGGKILEQKRRTMDEQSAQIQVSERHIAREQATLEDMDRQVRLLQDQMRTTADNIERDRVRLSQIGKAAEKARSEVESLSRELEDIKKELFS
ncbi:hypothetical protein B0A49_12347 [Cryomyces minteri]|uniref:BED-type domain-containing protein n=1 Tax=Cryomyces minteri TaxID=331657 RepID=A0A4U0WTT6_9PEZI|nr:hypothetical protein B0A49_12347 [Cryomyces minteri]